MGTIVNLIELDILVDEANDLENRLAKHCSDIASQLEIVMPEGYPYHVQHIPGDGICICIDLNDGEVPHTIPIDHVISWLENHETLTVNELKSLSV